MLGRLGVDRGPKIVPVVDLENLGANWEVQVRRAVVAGYAKAAV